jgi:hypothetical protein
MRHLHGDVLAPRDMIIIQRITRDEFGVVTVIVQNVGESAATLQSIYVDDDVGSSIRAGDGVLNVPDVYEAPVGSPAVLGETVLAPAEKAKIVLSGNYTGLEKIKVGVTTDAGNFMELIKTF